MAGHAVAVLLQAKEIVQKFLERSKFGDIATVVGRLGDMRQNASVEVFPNAVDVSVEGGCVKFRNHERLAVHQVVAVERGGVIEDEQVIDRDDSGERT